MSRTSTPACGQGREDRGGHARPVLAGERDQQGLRGVVVHRDRGYPRARHSVSPARPRASMQRPGRGAPPGPGGPARPGAPGLQRPRPRHRRRPGRASTIVTAWSPRPASAEAATGDAGRRGSTGWGGAGRSARRRPRVATGRRRGRPARRRFRPGPRGAHGRPRRRRAPAAAGRAGTAQATAAPTRAGTRPTSAPVVTTASPASSAAALNALGPPSPTGSPATGRASPKPVAPALLSRPSASTSGSAPSAPPTRCAGVIADHAVDHRSLTTSPRSQAVPHQERRTDGRSTEVTRVRIRRGRRWLGLRPWPCSSSPT